MYHAFNEKLNNNVQLGKDEYNPSVEYINALANIKINAMISGNDVLWSDISKNTGAMFNVLPPTLPERGTFVRRPRSLTEQSDLSEISVDEVSADKSLATLRGDADDIPPPIISPSKSKAEQKAQEMEDLDSLLSEFNISDNSKSNNDVKDKTNDNDESGNKNKDDNNNSNAAANSALEFLGISGSNESKTSNNKKKKKKKKKGKKNDGGGSGGGGGGDKSQKKKKTPTASQIAAAEAAARRSKNKKKKK